MSGTKLLEAHDDISRRLLQSLWQTELLELRSPAAVDRAMITVASHWSVGLPPLLSLVGTKEELDFLSNDWSTQMLSVAATALRKTAWLQTLWMELVSENDRQVRR